MITGCMAVVTRQTNIIWVAFFAFDIVVEFLKEEAVWRRKKKITSAVESSFKYLQVKPNKYSLKTPLTNREFDLIMARCL